MTIEQVNLSEKEKKGFKQKWGLIIRLSLTISILFYLGYKLNWTELGKQFRQVDLAWLAAACFLVGITFIFGSIRWCLLLKVQDIFLPLKTVTALTLIGQFFNSFFLGSTGGDVIKTLYVLKYAPLKKAEATLSVIMDRVMGLFILLCIALIALPWNFHLLARRAEIKPIAVTLFVTFVVILGGAIGLAFIPFKRLPFFPHRLWQTIPRRDIIESIVAGFRQHGHSLHLTLEAIAYTFALWLFVFDAGYCIARATHLNVTFMQIPVIFSIVLCIISLPISIGGHGIREGAFIIMFAAFGVITIDKQTGGGKEPAILFSILFFAINSVWSLLGGLVYLTFQHNFVKIDAEKKVP
jgi:glycosyltransferase 2 family protein